MTRSRRVTIRDVAQHAGVSSGTVSRVLNNHADVAPDLREKVRQSAEQLGYPLEKAASRGSANVQPRDVAFLLDLPHVDARSTLLAPFWGQILSGAEAEARKHKRIRVVYRAVTPADDAYSIIDWLRRTHIGGALLVGVATPLVTAALRQNGVRAVVVEDRPTGTEFESVVSDYVSGGELATSHLIEAGHTRIGFVGGRFAPGTYRNEVWAIEARAVGYRNALAHAGLQWDPTMIASCDLTPSGSRDATRALLAQRPDITAIFCANDPTAAGSLQAASDAGLRVPEDLSIVGCDDEYGGETFPPLTTVQVAREMLGQFALRRLLHQLNGDDGFGSVTHVLPVDLVSRSSVARPRAIEAPSASAD